MELAPAESIPEQSVPRTFPQAVPFFYGWVIVAFAALAMMSTLPGRTHGLGVITERLLADSSLGFDRAQFGEMNFWATILGAAFCLPCGKLLDRFGIRGSLTIVTAALGTVVIAMTHMTGYWMFFALLLLTRGLGQSALSVVSLAMTGKWFSRRLSFAVGAYSVLTVLFFGAAFQVLRSHQEESWRALWGSLGYVLLLGIAPVSWLLVRSTPEECGLSVDGDERPADLDAAPLAGWTLKAALVEPCFWAFSIATSVYGLIAAGTSLFNQDILAERGFPADTFYKLTITTMWVGLGANFLASWLIPRFSLRWVMTLSLLFLGGSLLWLPFVTTMGGLWSYAVGYALGGGMMTVVFFTGYGQVFGRRHLGEIQGIAQMLTVFASALGPVLAAYAKEPQALIKRLASVGLASLADSSETAYHGSYTTFFYASAAVVLALAVWTVFLRIPQPGAASNAG